MGIVTLNEIIVYKLLVFDWNTWNHITVYELLTYIWLNIIDILSTYFFFFQVAVSILWYPAEIG